MSESTSNGDKLECPYCGCCITDPQEYFRNDGESHVFECDECEKKFHGSMDITVDYIGKPDCGLNSMEHVWGFDTEHYRHCDNCDACERKGEPK